MNSAFFAWSLTGIEIVGILVLVLILFGAKKIPELARGLGQGIREFKKSTREVQDELEAAMDTDRHSPPPPSRKIPSDTHARTEDRVEQPSSETKA